MKVNNKPPKQRLACIQTHTEFPWAQQRRAQKATVLSYDTYAGWKAEILLPSFYFVTTETAKGLSWVVWVKTKWDEILRNCWIVPEKQRTWVISPKGLPSRGRWKRRVSQHGRQGLTIRDWLTDGSQDDLKGVNSMDGEKEEWWKRKSKYRWLRWQSRSYAVLERSTSGCVALSPGESQKPFLLHCLQLEKALKCSQANHHEPSDSPWAGLRGLS